MAPCFSLSSFLEGHEKPCSTRTLKDFEGLGIAKVILTFFSIGLHVLAANLFWVYSVNLLYLSLPMASSCLDVH